MKKREVGEGKNSAQKDSFKAWLKKGAYWICQQERVGASIIDYKVFFKLLFLGRHTKNSWLLLFQYPT